MSGDEIEAKARSQGWVPKEEFRDDPGKWVDAQTFVERGEASLPILRERLDTMSKKLDDSQRMLRETNDRMESSLAEQRKTLQEAHEYQMRAARRRFDQELNAVKSKMRTAVEDGDTMAYDQAAAELENLEKTRPVEPEPKTDPQPGNKIDPELEKKVNAFASKNPWVFNRRLAGEAEIINNQFLAENPDKANDFDAQYQAIEAEMYKRYPSLNPEWTPPEKTNGQPKGGGAAAVDGGGMPFNTGPSGGNGKRTYNDLPPDAKEACDRYVKEEVMTVEQYLADYPWEQGIDRPQ